MSAQNDTGANVPNESCTDIDKKELVCRLDQLEDDRDRLQQKVEQLEEDRDRVQQKVEQQQETIDDQSETIDELEGKVDEQSEAIEELEGKVDELEGDRDRAALDRAETKQRVHGVEESVEAISVDENPTPGDGNTGIQQHELTPVEQLARSDDVDEVTNSPSVKRAVALLKNIDDWGSKTPKGIVLKSSDNPLSLLSADQDESLCWKQYYRAAQTLESLSKGSVTFVSSDRHGKMVILHEQSEAYSRIINGTLTASSAHEKA
jgi:hypothetical protein